MITPYSQQSKHMTCRFSQQLKFEYTLHIRLNAEKGRPSTLLQKDLVRGRIWQIAKDKKKLHTHVNICLYRGSLPHPLR